MASKAAALKNKLVFTINRNERIHDISHLSFIIKTTGFLFWKKETLQISGRIGMQSEKDAIDEIISEFSEDIEIVSNIRVKQDY